MQVRASTPVRRRQTPVACSDLMREVLLGQPKLQVAFKYRLHVEEANPGVPHLINPRNFSLKLHLDLALRKLEADSNRAGNRDWVRQPDAHAALAEVQKMTFDPLSGSVREAYRQVKSMAVVAEPAIENHVTCR